MKVQTLNDLLLDELKDIYHAEKQLTKALPKMAKSSESEELRMAFQQHTEETKRQVARLERVFEHLEAKAKAKPCAGMLGLLEEGSEMMEQDAEGPLYDLGLVGSALRVEHYEIAAYTSLISMARQLGYSEVMELLRQNLMEEEATGKKLMQMSKGMLKSAPAAEDEYNDEDEPAGMEQEEEDEEVNV